MSKAPKAPPEIPTITSGADIDRITRIFWNLKSALEAAGLDKSKMQSVLDDLLFEIELGAVTSVSVKAYRAWRKSSLVRKFLKPPKWHAPAAARGDELKRKWPKYTANRMATIICKEGEIEGLARHRQVADFLKERYR